MATLYCVGIDYPFLEDAGNNDNVDDDDDDEEEEQEQEQNEEDDDDEEKEEEDDDERVFLLTPNASCAYFSNSSFTWLALGIGILQIFFIFISLDNCFKIVNGLFWANTFLTRSFPGLNASSKLCQLIVHFFGYFV